MVRYVTKEFALSSPFRVKMLEVVGQQPGINMANLAIRLDCKPSTVIWHARKLEAAGMLRNQKAGHLRIFYLPGGADIRMQTRESALLNNDIARRMHEIVRQEPGITFQGLQQRLIDNIYSLRWHAKRLAEAGLLCLGSEGRSITLYPTQGPVAPCSHVAA